MDWINFNDMPDFIADMENILKRENLSVTEEEVWEIIQGQNHFYKERSKGDFEIISDTPEIRAIFENIKARIKEMKEKERRK